MLGAESRRRRKRAADLAVLCELATADRELCDAREVSTVLDLEFCIEQKRCTTEIGEIEVETGGLSVAHRFHVREPRRDLRLVWDERGQCFPLGALLALATVRQVEKVSIPCVVELVRTVDLDTACEHHFNQRTVQDCPTELALDVVTDHWYASLGCHVREFAYAHN